MEAVTASLYLDTRRAKQSGLFPLKLHVYQDDDNRKYYPLKMDMSIADFERSYQAAKPRQEYKELKVRLEAMLARANNIIKELKQFTFAGFEKRWDNSKASTESLNHHYSSYISTLINEGRINTAESYTNSLSSITSFYRHKGGKAALIPFGEITPAFLNNYEKWMVLEGNTKTTVGFYLRPLRAIFNNAIKGKDIEPELYPFGKGKYQIPGGRKVKKALDKEILGQLFKYEAVVPQQIHARDYWFFSYCCNGMNVRDIAELRNKNLQGTYLSFYRTKTINTTKTDSKPIIVPLNTFAKQIIDKYRNKDTSPEGYLFPILTPGLSDKRKVATVKNFTRYINQHIKRLAKLAGITDELSTNWGRHSFTTNAIRDGASMEYIKDALGHNSINTTNNYFGGFEDNVKQSVSDKLMSFTDS